MLLLVKNHSTSRRSTAAMVITESCPACGSTRYKKNGHTRHGQQNHQCKACARQCGATAEDHRSADARRSMVEPLLRERISLRGICRAVGVSLTWLLPYRPTDVVLRRLEAEADEMGSFAKNKANKQWIWIAM